MESNIALQEPLEWFWKNEKDVFDAMKATGHGKDGFSPYHLEGDVFTHTIMVYHMASSTSYGTEYMGYKLAALLHDIGKVFCHEVKGDKKFFTGHEGRSFFEALPFLLKYSNDPNTHYIGQDAIAWVLFAIANHGIFMSKKNFSQNDINKMFGIFGEGYIDDLIKLLEHDSVGRIKQPSHVGNGYDVRNVIRMLEKVEFQSREPMDNTVTLMVGLPGSGKSTYAKKLADEQNTIILSRDDIVMNMAKDNSTYEKAFNTVDHKAVDKELMAKYHKALKDKKNVVIDMTNLSKKSRKKWIVAARDKNYSVDAFVFPTDVDTCSNRRSTHGSDDNKTVPSSVIQTMANKFTFPLGDEVDMVFLR